MVWVVWGLLAGLGCVGDVERRVSCVKRKGEKRRE